MISSKALGPSTRSPARVDGWLNLLVPFLNLLATIQVVWFYLSRVSCYVDLAAYEQGRAPTPFQYRVLMMAPLRWAHGSPMLNRVASSLSTQRAWFPHGVRPEGLVEAVIDLASVALAGLIARQLYRRASRTGLLTPYIYPLTLCMITTTYALLAYHSYRFTSDLPGVALFSLALYLLYIRAPWVWFAAVFLLGTVNRETTLLLLLFMLLASCARRDGVRWRLAWSASNFLRVAPLLGFWVGWKLWVHHVYAANPSLAQSLLGLNLGILAIPLAWPQLCSVFFYLLPLVVLYRHYVSDAVLRAWLWALPAWFAVMLYYGVIVEIRIFGELIPYLACVAALIAEERIVLFLDLGQERGRARTVALQ